MFKASLITLNLIAIVLIKFFLGGEITINQTIPESIHSGEAFIVEVLIEKGDQEGFAKWQQKLPEGFVATIKESKGATFSFKNQEVKLIWMALPKEESITIAYEISTDPSLTGNYDLVGKFSFIEENERKDISSNTSTIMIGEPVLANEEAATESNTEEKETIKDESIPNNSPLQADISNDNSNENGSSELITDDENIKIKRTVTHIENAEYRVNLEIEKGNFKSFGKIEEYIPEGFVASSEENNEGIFSFKNGVVKVLWMSLPKKSTLNLSYLLKSESDLLEVATVHGVFSYLNQDESIQLELKPSRFKNYLATNDEEIASNDEIENENEEIENENLVQETTNNTASNEVLEEKIEAEEEISNIVESKEEELIESITNIPSPESNVNYKVQISAGRKEVEKNYFEKKHKITESVSIEFHNNWFKYTVGQYNEYKQARDKRNEIWTNNNKINDAFVTAYNSGERITVQEAIMISKQKWYK